MSNPIEPREKIELERTLDAIDALLEKVHAEADKLPDRWQTKRCDAFWDKLIDAKQIAKEAMELWQH